MKNPKFSQLLVLAEKLSNKIAQTLALETDQKAKNVNQQFENQREFGRELNRKLRALISELNGDLWTLKERKFDHKMLRMAIKVKTELE